MDELVIAASFSTPIEAHLFKTRLEAEDIPCLIANEHLTGVNPLWSDMVHGVQVKVRRVDRERVAQILRESSDES